MKSVLSYLNMKSISMIWGSLPPYKSFNIVLTITFTLGTKGSGEATPDDLSHIIEIDFILKHF